MRGLAGRRVRMAPLLWLSLLVGACRGAERQAAGDWSAAYDTVGDTVVVRTLAGSVWGDTAELVEELRIGTLEGADEYMFGDVRGLAVGPDGALYILDTQIPALRKYAPDGNYLATFGRKGGGPGEYKRPDGGLAVLPDGRVLLRDPGNGRITVYSADGEYLESWRIRGGFSTSLPLFTDTAGNAYPMILLEPEADVTEWRLGLVRYGPNGVPGDTLPAPTWDYRPAQVVARRVEGENASTSGYIVPFTPTPIWTFSPLGYFVAGLSTRYAFDLRIAPDRVVRIERADWRPVPVKPGEKAEWERRITAMLRQVDPDWRWTGESNPDSKPPYAGLFVGQRGRIWVWLHQEARKVEGEAATTEPEKTGRIPDRTWREPVAFDVFEPDGRYLGTVRAPDGFSVQPAPVVRGDTVWAVVRGELGVPFAVRFRVARGEARGDVTGTPDHRR